ncbi:MAG: hypothetical protein JWN72_2645 [Thermoleophilia bacterium]|nr:hypothetical protein [Thermoleophilia bacterium]
MQRRLKSTLGWIVAIGISSTIATFGGVTGIGHRAAKAEREHLAKGAVPAGTKAANYAQFTGSVKTGMDAGWVRVSATWANAPATVRVVSNGRRNIVKRGDYTDLTGFQPGEQVNVTFVSTVTGHTVGTARGTAHG